MTMNIAPSGNMNWQVDKVVSKRKKKNKEVFLALLLGAVIVAQVWIISTMCHQQDVFEQLLVEMAMHNQRADNFAELLEEVGDDGEKNYDRIENLCRDIARGHY